jgi:hypothetical protein
VRKGESDGEREEAISGLVNISIVLRTFYNIKSIKCKFKSSSSIVPAHFLL